MALQSSSRKYVWAFPILVLVIVLFIILKPSEKNISTANTTDKTNSSVSVIRIAVPDLSSSDKPSGGSSLIDHLYVNKLLEKEFEKDHIKIEWQFFKGAGPVINEALVNGQLDFAFLGNLAAIIGKSNQIDTKLLLATGRDVHGYIAVQPNQGYKTIYDLKGKRIAIWQGTAAQLSFNQFLTNYGLSEKDFRIVNLDPAAANAALVAKQIDAGWGAIGLIALQQRGVVDILASSKETQNALGSYQSGLIGLNQFVTQHPEITQRLVTTILKSSAWVAAPENRDAAIKLVVENASYPYELYAAGFQGQDFKDVYSPLLDEKFVNQFKGGVKTALATQLIRQDFDVDTWVDDRFVKQGIKELDDQNIW